MFINLHYKQQTLVENNWNLLLIKLWDDLNANIEDVQRQSGQKTNRRKIKEVKKVLKISTKEKKYIENKLNSSRWLQELLDDQLKDGEYYSFGENSEELGSISNTPRSSRFDKRKSPYENATTQKRKKLMLITSEKRLKELPSTYTEITANQTNKIEASKKVFDKIIKQVPFNQKKFKIEYNKKKYL